MAGLELATASWGVWLGLVCLGGVLLLDDTAVAQTWLSQPLAAGILAGWVCGDPLTGAVVGLPLQLAVLGNLPVGQGFVSEPTTATVAAVGAVATTGHRLQLVDAVGVGGAAPVLGWLLLGATLAVLAGHPAVQAERRAHFAWMLAGHRTLRDGDLGRIDGLQRRCLAVTAARGALQTLLWLAVLTWIWLPVQELLPAYWQRGLGWLPPVAAGVAVGVVLERHRRGPAALWLLAGAALGFAVVRF
jgi:mannose/fructose/N-acetylgalactosamine-specific phosphotransferase system component IIC